MSESVELLGRMLVYLGLAMIISGLMLLLVGRLGGGQGLPGDIVIRRPGLVVYIPVASAILASLFLSLLFTLFALLRR